MLFFFFKSHLKSITPAYIKNDITLWQFVSIYLHEFIYLFLSLGVFTKHFTKIQFEAGDYQGFGAVFILQKKALGCVVLVPSGADVD